MSAAGRRGELVRRRVGVGGESASSFVELRRAALRRRRALRARARGRGRPTAASRRRRSASCAAQVRRTSRAAAAARGRARRRTHRARSRTPRRAAPRPGRRPARGSAGRDRPGNGCARKSREQKPWIVEIHAPSSRRARSWRPRACSAARIRARSSPAALRVYVITSSDSTSSPCSQTARTNRSTRTVVLPVPAPAETNTSPVASTAARCSAFTTARSGTSSRGRTRPGTRRPSGRA